MAGQVGNSLVSINKIFCRARFYWVGQNDFNFSKRFFFYLRMSIHDSCALPSPLPLFFYSSLHCCFFPPIFFSFLFFRRTILISSKRGHDQNEIALRMNMYAGSSNGEGRKIGEKRSAGWIFFF